jgi:hypothetical protein
MSYILITLQKFGVKMLLTVTITCHFGAATTNRIISFVIMYTGEAKDFVAIAGGF